MKPNLQVFFYSVFSGILLSLAIPNELFSFGQPLIGFISIIPLYKAFKLTKSYKQAFVTGFLNTFVTHIISSYWLAFFKDFAVFTLGASALGTGCIGGIFGFLFYVPYSENSSKNKLRTFQLYKPFYQTSFFRIIYFTTVWIGYEWFKSSGFLGYPWGTVSSTMYSFSVLTQIADLTGTYGISFFAVFTAAIFSEFFICNDDSHFKKLLYSKIYKFLINGKIKFSWKRFLLASPKTEERIQSLYTAAASWSVLFVLILIYGGYKIHKNWEPKKSLTAIMVQQNSDPWKSVTDYNTVLESEQLTEEQLDKLHQENKDCQLIIWSEGCLKRSFPSAYAYYREFPVENPLISFIARCNTPFIVGGLYTKNIETLRFMNVAHAFDKQGFYRGYYAKNHLVPFAEVIPFSENPFISNILKKTVKISAGYVPGDQYVYFEVPCTLLGEPSPQTYKTIDLTQSYYQVQNSEPSVKFAVPICFDDAFTDIMRPLFKGGAELFVNISDDSWSLKESSEIQHFVIASYRAIEYRTTLVRSTNSGYSVVVDPTGKVIADQPMFEAHASTVEIPIYEHKETLFSLLGNYFPYSCLIFIFISVSIFHKNFAIYDYIPSERKIHKGKKSGKKHKEKKTKLKNKK